MCAGSLSRRSGVYFLIRRWKSNLRGFGRLSVGSKKPLGSAPVTVPKNRHSMEPKYSTLLQALFIAVLLGVVVHFYEPGAPGPTSTAELVSQ